MKPVVRSASLADVDWVMKYLPDISRFYGTKRPLHEDPVYARAGVEALLRDHLLLIATSNGDPCGFIGGYLTVHPLNGHLRSLAEVLWWVPACWGRARIGVTLLDAFVDWGKLNADWIYFSRKPKSPAGHRAMLRRGFRLQELVYLREV